MAYVSYATAAQVASYTGKAIESLPSDIDQLISKASDLITNSIMVDITSAHTEALQLATCAQVEYWLSVGDQDENTGRIQSWSAGAESVTYASITGADSKQALCTRARGYLNKAMLLTRAGRLRFPRSELDL